MTTSSNNSRKLSRLKLDETLEGGLAHALQRGHRLTTVADVLHHTDVDLVDMLDVPHASALRLIRLASSAACPMPTNALALHAAQSHKIPTGVAKLDHALHGGVRCGEITCVWLVAVMGARARAYTRLPLIC